MRLKALILLLVASYGVNAQQPSQRPVRCSVPSGLSTSGITTSSATANWASVSGANSYSVDYKASSSSTWISLTSATTSLSWNLTGLPASTSFDWRVRTNCNSGSSSYVQTSFTTLSQGGGGTCNTPTGLSTINITSTTATATWAPATGAVSYDVDYRLAGSSEWTPYLIARNSLQCIFSYLQPTTSYEWRVRANCSSGSSSYSQTQFTTGVVGSCVPPGGLATIGFTSTTATVTWGSVSGAYGYTLEYKPTTSSLWLIAANTDLTTIQIFSLTAGITYDWRVRSNCGLSEASEYSYSQFTMPGSTSTCPGSYDVVTNGLPGGAAAIPLNTDIKGTVSEKYDVDHYAFSISSGGTITVSLTTLPANYDLAVLSSNGTQIGISQKNSSQSESISLTVAAGTYYAKVFPGGTANNATSCYTLRVQTGTAAKTMAAATPENVNPEFAINLFPNPAGDQLNVWVEGTGKNAEIKLYNLTGKLVMQQQSNKMLTQLNTSKLPAGIYLLNVNNGKEVKTAKFIKQ